jgi:MoxR-like ATPase
VRSVRITRDHPELRIGSSVRGAIDTVLIAVNWHRPRAEGIEDATGLDAALAALTGKVTSPTARRGRWRTSSPTSAPGR